MRLCLSCFFLFLTFCQLDGQNKQELQREKESLARELEETARLLDEVRDNKSSNLAELNMLQKKLRTREKLIGNIKAQQNILITDIDQTELDIVDLTSDLQLQKDEYAKMIRYAYKTRDSFDLLVFLFASDSFNDAVNRFQYIRYYNNYRKEKAANITATKDTLENKLLSLESQKLEKGELLTAEQSEVNTLDRERRKQGSIVGELKKKESDLKYKIEVKKVAIEQLNTAISRIISSKIKSTNSAGTSFALTPEAKALSSKFSSNRGDLPWPVGRGVLTGTFGLNKHPVFPGITIENNGIDISTSKGEVAMCVFDGKVSEIIFSPSFQKAIIINHGEYFTTYSNLKEVSVTEGQSVTTGQVIGTIYSDGSNGKTELHFELWKGIQKLNPQQWILKR